MNHSANLLFTIDLYKYRIIEIDNFLDQIFNYIYLMEKSKDIYFEKIQKFKKMIEKLHKKKINLETRIEFIKDEVRRLNNLPFEEWIRIHLFI